MHTDVMHAEVAFPLATLAAFLLALARVSGVLVFAPIPGFSAAPDAARVVLALALTGALFPAWPTAAEGLLSLGGLTAGVLRETALGMAVGLVLALLLEGFQLSAQAVGLQAGYSYASTIDPTTEADTTTLQLMAQLAAGALFFAWGFDRQVLRALAQSFQSEPGAAFWRDGRLVEAIAALGAQVFSTGLQLAMPVLALLVLLDIAFAVLGRLHAQLQLLSLAFSVKMLAALAFLAGILAMYPAVFERSGELTFATLDRLLK